ncbi:MAG TPA: diguanylate cyclase [Burkholderiaceae bacterium]|nr:diguanylate cyclase [Burkholderiaceae bacterium]
MSSVVVETAEDLLQRTQAAVKRGDHREGARLAELALGALDDADTVRRARTLRLLALHRMRLGEAEASARAAGDAITLYRELADPLGEGDTLNVLCMAYNQLGLHREALEFAIRALALAREAMNPRLQCWALLRVGYSYENLADPQRSLQYTLQAMQLARTLPDGEEELFASLNNLASGELAAAEHHTRDGHDAAAQASLADARAHVSEALVLARRSGNTHRETIALGILAEAACHSTDHSEAQALVDQYQAMARRHGYRSLELQADFDLACLLRKGRRHALAVQRLERLLADSTQCDGDPALRLRIEHALYDSNKALGRHEAALKHLEMHARLEREHLKAQAEAQARVLLARMEIDQAHAEAERARLDAQLQRLRTQQLEEEQRVLRAHADALGRAASEDALTGLRNRRVLDEALPQLLERASREHAPVAVAMADLDHFKLINDRFGHGLGDRVLTALAQLLRANTRGADLLARVGGEEFLVVLDGAPIDLAQEICERLRVAVAAHPWHELAAGLKVSLSVGLVAGAAGEDRERLIARADAALYEAKRRGRNRVHRG